MEPCYMTDKRKPHFTTLNLRAEVIKKDPEFNKPEVVYRFSNGKEKTSTDRTESGIYKRN